MYAKSTAREARPVHRVPLRECARVQEAWQVLPPPPPLVWQLRTANLSHDHHGPGPDSGGVLCRDSMAEESSATAPSSLPPPSSGLPPNRARARGIYQAGTAVAHADEPEAWELDASTHEPVTMVQAGFDPLTSGEKSWMLASAAVTLIIVAIGLYISLA